MDGQTDRKLWTPDLCRSCLVPDIVRANACPNMELTGHVKKGFLGFSRRVQVEAFCTLSRGEVREPQVGCGQCHPLPPEFLEKKS